MPSLRPILPRNLTARADYLVDGNPMTARPESGVGNAHPGLEFDVRTLDRHFVPGLVFDFQFGAGAKLVAITSQANAGPQSLSPDDLQDDPFLLFVRARFGTAPDTETTVRLHNLDGYLVLRQLIDLEPGNRIVAIGPLPKSSADLRALDALEAMLASDPEPVVKRDHGKLTYAIVRGVRQHYLTEEGVIDPELIAPGELTRNLCSPWQWDFADCYCYYWASSKPDLVVGITGEAQVLNFQRDRTAREPRHPPATADAWMDGNMSEAEMIANWETLPVVTSGREGVVPRVPDWPLIKPEQKLTLEEIKAELPGLAMLEHALCVEYLFAKHSIAAPQAEPHRWRKGQRRRYRAAREVFSIAIDEMRHFRWVNEMLRMLECAPTVQRATVIGRDLRRNFSLRPLRPDVLDEFIGIEAPSSIFNSDPQQLDGMYTQILVSLHHLRDRTNRPGDLDVIGRLEQLVKNIIDEGDGHWHRFRRVKEHLAGDKPASYLRPLALEVPPPPWASVRELADAYYTLLLETLFITFCLGRISRGLWLNISHLAMFALDDTAYFLAKAGYGVAYQSSVLHSASPPIFKLGKDELYCTKQLGDLLPDHSAINALFAPVVGIIGRLKKEQRASVRAFADRHSEKMNMMSGAVRKAFDAHVSP